MAFAGPGVAVVAVPLVLVAWRRPPPARGARARTRSPPRARRRLRPVQAGQVRLAAQHPVADALRPREHARLARRSRCCSSTSPAFGAGGAPSCALRARRHRPPQSRLATGATGPRVSSRGSSPSGPMHAVVTFVRQRLGRPVESAPPPDPNLISLPGSGLGRSLALLRAFRREQQDPDYFYRTIALDTLHRLTGATPLFNRTVVDVGGGAGYFAEAFRDAGARVDPRRARGGRAPAARARRPRGRTLDAAPAPRARGVARSAAARRHRRRRRARAAAADERRGPRLLAPTCSSTCATPGGSSTRPCGSRGPAGSCTSRSRCGGGRGAGTRRRRGTCSAAGFAMRRYTKKHGHPPKNVYGESLFKLHVGRCSGSSSSATTSSCSSPSRATTRGGRAGSCRVPVVRELVTWNLVVLLEKL